MPDLRTPGTYATNEVSGLRRREYGELGARKSDEQKDNKATRFAASTGLEYPCFDSVEQYRSWLRLANTAPYVSSPCRDCDPENKAEMVEAHRCRFPLTNFRDSKSDGLQGSPVTTQALYDPNTLRVHLRYPWSVLGVTKCGFVYVGNQLLPGEPIDGIWCVKCLAK